MIVKSSAQTSWGVATLLKESLRFTARHFLKILVLLSPLLVISLLLVGTFSLEAYSGILALSVYLASYIPLACFVALDGKASLRVTYIQSKSPRAAGAYLAVVLFNIIVNISSLFLFLPGVYLTARFGLFIYFSLEKGLGALDALRASWRATRKGQGRIFTALLILSIPLIVSLAVSLWLGHSYYVITAIVSALELPLSLALLRAAYVRSADSDPAILAHITPKYVSDVPLGKAPSMPWTKGRKVAFAASLVLLASMIVFFVWLRYFSAPPAPVFDVHVSDAAYSRQSIPATLSGEIGDPKLQKLRTISASGSVLGGYAGDYLFIDHNNPYNEPPFAVTIVIKKYTSAAAAQEGLTALISDGKLHVLERRKKDTEKWVTSTTRESSNSAINLLKGKSNFEEKLSWTSGAYLLDVTAYTRAAGLYPMAIDRRNDTAAAWLKYLQSLQ